MTPKSSNSKNTERAKRPRKVPIEQQPPDSGKIIKELYTDSAGEKDEALLTIEKSKKRSTKPLVVTIVVLSVLVATTVAGFFAFNRRQQFNEKGVTLAIETPNSVSSAGEATLTYIVTNDSPVAIRNVELSVSAPDGWSFKQSEPPPRDSNNTLWQLGTIPSRAKRSVVIIGTLVGEVGTVKIFNASVTYRPSNFNYDFTAKASGSVKIGSSILELSLEGPPEVSPGTNVRYVVSYTNTSDDDIAGIRLTATYPDTFQKKSFDPKPREGDNVWIIDELKSGGTGTIAIEGSFAGEIGDSHQLSFVAELQRGAQFERQVEASLVILLVASTLDISLSVNDEEKNTVASPGQSLAYTLSYKNTSDLEVDNVAFSVELSGGALDPKTFSDDYGSSLKEGKVSWDKKIVPALANIKPKASGTVRFSLKVPEAPQVTKDAGGPTLSANVKATIGGTKDDGGKVRTITKEPLVTKIVSRATLNVDPRYYGDDGEQLGSGPLPPTVGATTTYRMSWYLGNTTNELKDVIVKAIVPATVFWTGRNNSTSAGTMSFDPATRLVTWSINRLLAGVGQETPTLVANFDLSVTPESADVGSIMMLLDPSTLTATDTFTGRTITVKRDRASTDLPNDTRAIGKSIVVQ